MPVRGPRHLAVALAVLVPLLAAPAGIGGAAQPTSRPASDRVVGEGSELLAAADRLVDSLDRASLRAVPAARRHVAQLRRLLREADRGRDGDRQLLAAILGRMDRIGELVAPVHTPDEGLSLRLEEELGTPRCHQKGIDDGAAYCADEEWLTTRSQNFVNIRGEVFWRGARPTPQGRQLSASFVASEDATEVAVAFAGEAYVEDDTPGTHRRLFVQALVDGEPADPGDVVLAVGDRRGVRSFVFTTAVDAGIHTVEMRWRVDGGATAYLRDASLQVRTGRSLPSNFGTLLAHTPPSGANQQTTSSAWSPVPDMSSYVYVGAHGGLTATMAAETAVTGGKRMALRARVDGALLSPSNVIFARGARPQSRTTVFGADGLTPGWHLVSFEWQVEEGGTAVLGDRSLVVASYPEPGHPFVAAPSGPSAVTQTAGLEPMPDMQADVSIPERGNGELAVRLSAETGSTGGAAVVATLAVDGAIQTDGLVELTDGSGGAEVRSWVFQAKGLSAGAHELEIWWGAGAPGAGLVGDRTLAVASEVGFVPDLAEAPRFAGGHVNWDGDYIAGIEPLIGSRRVLAVLWDPGTCGDPGDIAPGPPPDYCQTLRTQDQVPRGKVEAALFGQGGGGGGLVQFEPDNVASYFAAMSAGRFTIDRAGSGVAGYYDALSGPAQYFAHPGTCQNGFDSGGDLQIAEAVALSDPDVDYAQFDVDGDGRLREHELAIIVVTPRKNGDGSSLATLSSQTCPTRQPMVLDGVELPRSVAKWNTSLDDDIEPFQFTTGAHELMHVFMLLDDAYLDTDWATFARRLGLMASNRFTTTHLDPFQKLALGWVTPRLVTDDALLKIRAVEQSDTVWVLPRYDNPHDEELVVVENRQDGLGQGLFDDNIADSGIAVWHIVSDMQQITNSPIGVPEDVWDELGVDAGRPGSVGQMARKGIRLIRPFDDLEGATAVYDNKDDTLWDNSWYDLASGGCLLVVPSGQSFRNQLAWADCSPSGYSLEFLTGPGVEMNVRVSVD